MIKRIIEISSKPMHLSIRMDQLVLEAKSEGCGVATIPCEDIGVLVVDHPHTTFTHGVPAKLAQMGAVVVFCGANHLPISIALPTSSNTLVAARLRQQVGASRPTVKNLWKQIIVNKVKNQAANLDHVPVIQRRLTLLASEVKSGDPTNIEAQAARAYWSAWLEENANSPTGHFRRDQDGDGINALLNYGYALFRAAVARAIVSAGLTPAWGIHHKNRSNNFALADDLLEPLRPTVDRTVQGLVRDGLVVLDKVTKVALLKLLHGTFEQNGQTGPLMVVLHRYTASFIRCLCGESKKLQIPHAITDIQ